MGKPNEHVDVSLQMSHIYPRAKNLSKVNRHYNENELLFKYEECTVLKLIRMMKLLTIWQVKTMIKSKWNKRGEVGRDFIIATLIYLYSDQV